jgi:SAM-dependent methyltransferase
VTEQDEHHHDDGQSSADEHAHGHGHAPERGWLAGFRYVKLIRKFWRSDVNNAVIALIDPQDGEHVLDIGAGLGAGAVVAAARVGSGSVIAVDPLPGMRLLMNVRRLRPSRFRRIAVRNGTAEALPVDTGTIDAAYATNALHHFDDIDAAAAEVSRVTKPGARVVFVEEQFTNPEHPSYEKFGGDDHDDHEHRFHAVDLEKVSTVMDAAGFDVVEASDTTIADVPAKLVRLQRR